MGFHFLLLNIFCLSQIFTDKFTTHAKQDISNLTNCSMAGPLDSLLVLSAHSFASNLQPLFLNSRKVRKVSMKEYSELWFD